ncbi:MAG: Ig domain-containing protein [Paludibacteraceae bacterium]|nr:Ig domain-containing protein [Paludibacteraceae bacterium]
MKANKFFAVALAALALVGMNACKDPNKPVDPEQEDALTLDQTSVQLKVGETATVKATVEATWTSSDAEVATVAGNGKEAVITAVKEGSAVVSATTKGGQTKTCIVSVKKGGSDPQGKQLKGSQVWPIALDGTTADANASKIVADFRPNDVDQFLYVWESGTVYEAGEGKGLNFHGNTDGYTALKVTNLGWAGAGFCLTDKGNGWQAAEALRAAIVANPDQYFLHMAMKSTDNYSHCFYMFGSEATKFVIGSKSVYDGPVYKDFTRDGSWQEFDIPMSQYATALANTTCAAGVNVFVVLTEGVQGAELNLDAVYFYKN